MKKNKKFQYIVFKNNKGVVAIMLPKKGVKFISKEMYSEKENKLNLEDEKEK